MIKKTKKNHNKIENSEETQKTINSEKTTAKEEYEAIEKATADQAEKSKEEANVEEKYAALNDKYLRLMAEYDNYRKRTSREFSEMVETASEELIKQLLPILDNLDRATEHRSNKTTYEEYVKGIANIEDQLRAVLKGIGLEPIEVVGKKFDPTIHDAIMQIESDDFEPGIVTAEAEKGYMLSGKIIRHPKVVVSK